MNCETTRNRLLALPDPAEVPPPLVAHLDSCPTCQSWHQMLVRIEEGIVATAAPVGSGRTKRKLIAQFRESVPAAPKPVAKVRAVRPAAMTVATIQPSPQRQSLGERLARLWPAGLVAAALLVGVLVWSSLRGKPEGSTVAALPADPFLEKVVAAKVKLDTAPNAAARLSVLDSLERGIHEEAKTLSKVTPGADMESLARMYEQVVAEGMVEQARGLTRDQRRATLDQYVTRLNTAAEEAHRLAGEAPPGSVRPLLDIEQAALKGRTELSLMIQGQGS